MKFIAFKVIKKLYEQCLNLEVDKPKILKSNPLKILILKRKNLHHLLKFKH